MHLIRVLYGRPTMTDVAPYKPRPKETVLNGWISRLDLALELGVTVETLRRWEKIRFGPRCVRAGRKIYYRRAAVQSWLEDQERATPRRARAGGRR